VAIVPASGSPTVEVTVAQLVATGRVDRVVVVDDGSTDDTAARAAAAGATVVSMPLNWGKGDAVAAGVRFAADAEVYLLVDADLAATARHVVALLDPVLDGSADLAIATFPPAEGRGGFGAVKAASRWLVRRASGYEPVEPLSGQRAVRGPLLRALPAAARFGLEVGMTIDAARAGARIVEVPLPLDHAHTGRTLAGFRHRGGQAVDIVRAAGARWGTGRSRRGAMVAATVVVLLVAILPGWRAFHAGTAIGARSGRPVVLVTISDVSLADLDRGVLPNVSALLARSGGALTPRTPAPVGDQGSAYATLGAGAPVVLRHGRPVRSRRAYGRVGALGDALHGAGLRTAYVGARSGGDPGRQPARLAIADGDGVVDVTRPGVLPLDAGEDATAASVADRLSAIEAAMAEADVVVVDAGGAPVPWRRADGPTTRAVRRARHELRLQQAWLADRLVGALVSAHPDALVVAAGVAPPSHWRLTPLATSGDAAGPLGSPSTRRSGLATLTDLAPTVLAALRVDVPSTMIGQRLVSGHGRPDVAAIRDLHLRTAAREGLSGLLTVGFVAAQAIVYGAALVALVRRRRRGRWVEGVLAAAERLALACAAFPMVTFLYRLAPVGWQQPLVAAAAMSAASFAVATLALRSRHHPLSPLVWIAGATVAVMAVDAATSGALEDVSLLGYTPLSAARFYGMGNIGFAVLGATAILLAGSWVASSPRRADGLVAAACLLVAVTTLDVAPMSGADFGGALSLIPTLLVALALWAGCRLDLRRTVSIVAGAITLIGLVLVAQRWLGGTHVSRFLAGDGDGVWATIARKVDTNLRVLRVSDWSWMLVVVGGFVAASMRLGGRWREAWSRWFGPAAAWRTTLALLLVFGALGGAANDSGVVIPAVVLVYVGAYVLAVQRRRPFAPPRVTVGR
jgi:hypothetical protein